MQTKKSIFLESDTISRVIRDAGYPSTNLPLSVYIEAPYAAGPQLIDIYAREDDPSDPLHYILRARFASQEPLQVVGGAAQIECEFTIKVNLQQRYSEVIFTVTPPPRH